MFDSGVNVDFLEMDERVPENVCSVVIKFIKAIPDGGLLTRSLKPSFFEAVEEYQTQPETALVHIKELIASLPLVHRENLLFFVDHLRQVAENSNVNKMTAPLLGRTWGIMASPSFGELLEILILHPEVL